MKTAFVATIALFFPCAAVLASNPMSISQELDAQYSYVGDAKTRGPGLNAGSIDEHSTDIKYVISPQVNRDLLLRFGLEWQRFSFGVPDHAAVPRVLQQVSGVLASTIRSWMNGSCARKWNPASTAIFGTSVGAISTPRWFSARCISPTPTSSGSSA